MRIALVLMLLFPCALSAVEVQLQARDVDPAIASKLENQIGPALRIIDDKTGLTLDPSERLTVVLHNTAKTFAANATRDRVGMHAESVLGYALARERRVVLNLSAIRERGLAPVGVLRHELAHIVIGVNIQVERPLWFEEGLAQWVEGVALNFLKESQSTQIPPTFDDLADLNAGLRDEGRVGFAYLEARRVLSLMEEFYGVQRIQKFLRALADGDEFNAAFAQTFQQTVEGFEDRWLKRQSSARAGNITAWVGANWWWLLFVAAAFVGLVALWRRQRKVADEMLKMAESEYEDPSDWAYHRDD